MREHKAKLGTVFLIVFIDLVGFGIVIPILPLYAEDLQPSPLVFGLLMASYSVMQFVFAPILGRLSDRYGRRPVLLVSLVGSVIGYLLFAFAGSIEMLFASRIIDGIAGGNISTAQAVIADITGERDRAKGMGLIGAAFGLGFICGPGIGGLLAGVAPWMPGVAAATASAIAFLLVLTVLPETLDPSLRRATRRHPLDPRTLAAGLRHPLVGLCLVGVFCAVFAFASFETTFGQFARFRFGLAKSEIYWLFVYAGVLGAVVQGGLVRVLVPRFGEARLVVVGTALSGVALAALPFVGSFSGMLAALALLALGQGTAAPSLTALTSTLVEPDEVGATMGVYQSMSSLGRIVGPFWAEVAYGSLGVAWPNLSGALSMFAASAVGAVLLLRLRAVALR